MATTTNYSWTTPDDTDLVKDGAAAIRTLGSSADTTVKNLNPGTTAGDIDYYTSSTAKARIAIGTAGQVLQVNAGATAPEWAAVVSATGPAISVYRTTDQTVTANTYTKVQFTSEEFDTDSCYDTSLHRFTPNVAGKYLIQHCIIGTGTQNYSILYKNGTRIKGVGQNTNGATANGSTLVDMNGTTDYIEFYAYITGSTTITGTAEYSYATAAWQRS